MARRVSSTVPRFFPDSLGLFSLFGLAMAQPLLHLLGNHPQFFVARQATPSEIIGLALFLCFLAPGCLVLISWCTAMWSPALWRCFHCVAVAGGSAALVLLLLNHYLKFSRALWLLPALAAGLLLAAAYWRLAALRLFFNALSPASFVFAGAFLLSPTISPLLSKQVLTRAELPNVEIQTPAPVVLVVFDELPLRSLLNTEAEIDSARFSNFAALARESTWYRRASVVAATTQFSIPSIVSGRFPDPAVGELATYAYHPENLFTLLGVQYNVRSFESITSLCPEVVCAPEDFHFASRLLATILDVSVLYLHILLPQRLADHVPGVNQTWGNFVKFAGLDLSLQEDPVEEFSRFTAGIRPDARPALHFLHSNLPHLPWVYLASGRQYLPWKIDYTTPQFWGEEPSLVALGWQRHFLQVLLADRLLGTLVQRLRETGLYERTLLIVVADHGASFRPGMARRDLTAGNYPDIMSVPLFIKFPHQEKGRVSDRHAETIDIVPTVADVLGAPIPWRVDGKSLLDDSGSRRYRRVVSADGLTPLVVSNDLRSYVHPVVCLGGEAVAARPGELAAYLDVVERRGERVLFLGWAADLKASQPADRILIFANRRQVHEGRTGFPRPDVRKVHSDRGLTASGFAFEVDSDLLDAQSEVRVLAVRGGQISEVIYPGEFPWRHPVPNEFDYEADPGGPCEENGETTLSHAFSAFVDNRGDFLAQLQQMARTADLEGLFRFPPCGRLVGETNAEGSIPPSPSLAATLFERSSYEQVDPNGPLVPTGVRGQLNVGHPDADMPAQVAVSVNGLIRGVAPTYTSPAGQTEFLVLVPENSFRAGPNRIEILAIDDLEACSLSRVPLARIMQEI